MSFGTWGEGTWHRDLAEAGHNGAVPLEMQLPTRGPQLHPTQDKQASPGCQQTPVADEGAVVGTHALAGAGETSRDPDCHTSTGGAAPSHAPQAAPDTRRKKRRPAPVASITSLTRMRSSAFRLAGSLFRYSLACAHRPQDDSPQEPRKGGPQGMARHASKSTPLLVRPACLAGHAWYLTFLLPVTSGPPSPGISRAH